MGTPPGGAVKRPPAGLLLGLCVGLPMMLVGVVGLVQNPDATPPSSFLRFFVGGDVLHDVVVAPLALLVGVLVIQRMPRFARIPLGSALFATAVAVAMAWPALRGYGRDRAPDNSTVQPLNYSTALATVLAVIWLVALVWLIASAVRRAHRR